MKVLIDHSVRQHGIVAHRGFERREGEVLGQTFQYLKLSEKPRPPRLDWMQAEIDVIPELVDLVGQGQIEAFTTNELEAEWFRAAKFPESYDTLFSGCEFGQLPAPLERSKWGLSAEQFVSKDDVISFCKNMLLTPSRDRIERFIEGMEQNSRFRLTEFETRCLRNVELFRAICYGIDEKHFPDALHLWTAEENEMDVFLTLDKKFRNLIEHRKVELRCKVMFPSEVLAAFTAQ
jgi:hypothetical protein